MRTNPNHRQSHTHSGSPWMGPASARISIWLIALGTCASGCYRQHEESRDLSNSAPQFSSGAKPNWPLPTLPRIPSLGASSTPRSPHASDADAGGPGAPPDAPELPVGPTPTDPQLKVALLGDQGMGDHARAVLQLVAQEHADMVIHLGDLSYDLATPADWEAQIDAALGPNFPYFVVIGNHDIPSWFTEGGFAQRMGARLARIPGAHCEGEYAINASCTYRGLHFVLSGVGTFGEAHEPFLRDVLENSTALHKLCIWHKNQHDMQVGGKGDEVGWEAYRICAAHGAPIITGHEHSYARTYTLTTLGDRDRNHGRVGRADELMLGPGRTFVAVSGLGGQSARSWTSDHSTDAWWASIYAGNLQLMNGEQHGTDPNIDFGALFVTFGVKGEPARAEAYFKTTQGLIADQFRWQLPTTSALEQGTR